MLKFFEKKVFGGCKSHIFFIGDQNVGQGDRITVARRRSERHMDDFAGSRGHSENLEARRSFFFGAYGAHAGLVFYNKYQRY